MQGITSALPNAELKRLQNEKKAKNARAKALKAATMNKHPKKKGGGKTRKSNKVRKTRKGRK